MKVFHLLFVLLFFAGTACAQLIAGIIKDKKQQPVPGTTVILYYLKDSSVVKFNASDNKGYFEFSQIPSGSYFITTSAIGFKDGSSGIFNVANSNLD